MLKISLILCAVLAGCCYWLFDSWEDTKKELTETKMLYEQAQQTIALKNAAIKASDEALIKLKEKNEKVEKERSDAEATLLQLLEKPDNVDWGKMAIPKDITDFLTNPKGLVQ